MKEVFSSISGRLRRHGGALALSGASQAVNSLTNFAIVLYLVRVLAKDDFGLYSLGFAAYLVIAGILAAMFAVQYMVNNPDQAQHDKRAYAMHHVAAVVMFSALLVMIAVLLKPALYAQLPGPESGIVNHIQELAFPVALAVLGFATRDMLVRIAYVERREWLVLGSAVITAAISALAFFTAYALSVIPGAAMALEFVAIGQIAGALFMFAMLGLPWRQFGLDGLRHTMTDSWQGGRWHAMTSIVYSMRAQAHNFIIPPIVGLAALAEVNAARVLLTPAVMVIPPLYQIIVPRLAEMRVRDPGHMQRATWLTVGGLVAFALAYSAALLLAQDWLLPLTLGQDYAHLGPVVAAWCAFTLFLAVRNGLTMGLEVSKRFRALLAVNTVAAVVAVMLAAGFAMSWGGLGAVWALVLAEFMLCALLLIPYVFTAENAKPSCMVISSNKIGG